MRRGILLLMSWLQKQANCCCRENSIFHVIPVMAWLTQAYRKGSAFQFACHKSPAGVNASLYQADDIDMADLLPEAAAIFHNITFNTGLKHVCATVQCNAYKTSE